MTTINERVSALISAFGDSESAFAKRIQVSSSVMFNIVNKKGRLSYPSGPVLEKILSLEKDGKQVSAEWLMRGNGEMLVSGDGLQITSPEAALSYLEKTIIDLKAKTK
ncbi:hypothetical protein [Roseivirga misakiensis]|uniref:Uncharacterized protein n=1 Tax=Roseivirga misakiensis TaxID=1563681 RepID=A0A1E5T5C0_9BACT|nr:hypothetical protein [Roseivirga misakiensis]OEK06569.1 hypothetical protein BFP71_02540 [Roseivirga misakiensis]